MNEILETAMPVAYAAVVILAFAAILAAIYYALKGGMISDDTLKTGMTVLEGVHKSVSALAEAMGSSAVSIAAFVLDAGRLAARAAEQMMKTGEISREERNRRAKEIAAELLELAGIEVTEEHMTALAVAIEAECDAMGHVLDVSTTATATVTGTPEEVRKLAMLLEREDVKPGFDVKGEAGPEGDEGPEGEAGCAATESAGKAPDEAPEEAPGEAPDEVEELKFDPEYDVVLPEVGSLAFGHELSDLSDDSAVYVGVKDEDGCCWMRLDRIDEEQARAAICANMPKADTQGMTLEEMRELIADFCTAEEDEKSGA